MEKALNYREMRPDLEEYLKSVEANRHPIALILDRVKNRRNIAALLRLADAARVKEVILYQCGIDTQEDNKVKKVARSAQEFVPQRSTHQLSDLTALQREYRLVGLEITNKSVPYYEYSGKVPLALVIGNEQRGISQEVLDLCEESVHVPMMGRNSSMNVAMASGIATYGLLKVIGKLT
ncbi:MAG TPA: TrmH family RNA methyltransferase [Saprospiraceae bacterium]|nr:TrmH family RNA methyltransferase [Saprospiraceae bacterium]